MTATARFDAQFPQSTGDLPVLSVNAAARRGSISEYKSRWWATIPESIRGRASSSSWSARAGQGERQRSPPGARRSTIARRIAAMIDGESLRGGGGGCRATVATGVRPGDVVLLFRSMSNVHLRAAMLRRQGLDYYLVGGRAFFAQQEIYDLLNLLARPWRTPATLCPLAGIQRRSPRSVALADEALFLPSATPRRPVGGTARDDAIHAQLPEDQRPRQGASPAVNLDRWHMLKDRLPISRLLGEVFADSGYDAAMQFEYLGDRKSANLWKLQEMARAFDQYRPVRPRGVHCPARRSGARAATRGAGGDATGER